MRSLDHADLILRRLAGKPTLRWLILFVTSKCNSRCSTCFYWRKMGHNPDLSLEQLHRLARTMPQFRTLLLSGGEPFLRPDLPEICRLFHMLNRITNVSIPTNGLTPDTTVALSERILRENPSMTLSVSVSLDGLRDTHDAIRGVPGGFERTVATLRGLASLKSRYNRLSLVVNTVICRESYAGLESLAAFVADLPGIDWHFFELIRGEPRNAAADSLAAHEVRKALRLAAEASLTYAGRRARGGSLLSRCASWLRAARIVHQYRIQFQNRIRGARWPVSCLAGQAIVVVEHDGAVKACELRPCFAHLTKMEYDFGRIWDAHERTKELQAIASEKCFCTHGCFIQSSISHSLSQMLLGTPLSLLRYALSRRSWPQ